MIAVLWKLLIGLAGTLFGSRVSSSITVLALVCGGLFAWHEFDKSSAVRSAVVGFVARADLAAAEAQAEELRAIIRATHEANGKLVMRTRQAEARVQAWAREIEAYDLETIQNPDGVVDSGLLDRLRSQ